ncbi:putative B3 domain-containing protein At1g78640 [Abrus precatorius]|uniref:B3 domain-containing protein At1g78640 n=1 Tax=Abrus precatorius TaxID=3816 RepID=A0A8B8JZP6_ABRPR|nr:putative B3 domain-containing protein At1g78640 [Abrus precatorius]
MRVMSLTCKSNWFKVSVLLILKINLDNGCLKQRMYPSDVGALELRYMSLQPRKGNIATKVPLYDDPWKIKKVLKESDLGNMSRLMLGKDLAEKFVLPVLGDAAEIEKGVSVKIWDVDTYTMHSLVFKKWASSRCYIFMGKWVQDFVKRRGLKKGDEIGFYWDPYNSHFNFSVLRVN